MKNFFICLLLLLLFYIGQVSAYESDFSDLENDDGKYIETIATVGVPNLNARSAILYDVTYDRILYEKNANQMRANASTTKMITALVAYENGNLNDIIEVSQNAASTGGSSIQLKVGDKITLNDLIEGLLIHSGNDAAVAIAEYISGNVEQFSKLMNEKAKEIGAVNTHFMTPHGLDEENHYSTAFDLALIAKEILKCEYLSKIISKTSAEITVNGITRTIGTTNEMLTVYEGANGVKTGYTGNAGRCIVVSAKREGRQMISVVLGCDSKKNRTIDSIRLLNYGFNEYQVTNLADYIKKDIYFNVSKSKEGIYRIGQNIKVLYPVKESEKDKIEAKYVMKENLIAPINRGENIGKVLFKVDGNLVKELEINLPDPIEKKSWKDFFESIFTESMENIVNFKNFSYLIIK